MSTSPKYKGMTGTQLVKKCTNMEVKVHYVTTEAHHFNCLNSQSARVYIFRVDFSMVHKTDWHIVAAILKPTFSM
jgi:hypothetical protein